MSANVSLVLLLLAVAACRIAISQVENEPLPYSVFETEYYEPIQNSVSSDLAPCGCLARNTTTDPLTVPNATPKTNTDQETLYQAETHIYAQLREQLASCSCAAGLGIVAEAEKSVARLSDPSSLVTKVEADNLREKLRTVLNSTSVKCCDPSQSQKTYGFVPGRFSFEAAVVDAQSRGGKIAAVTSRFESMAVFEAVKNQLGPTVGDGIFSWIGARKKGNPSVWEWNDARVHWGFQNWGYEASEVHPLGTESNPCASVAITQWTGESSGAPGQWNAIACQRELPYVIEISRTEAPKQSIKELTVVIAVLLSLFLLASVVIIARKLLGKRSSKTPSSSSASRTARRPPTSSSNGLPPQRRVRRTIQRDDGDIEMGAARPTIGSGRRRQGSSSRRVQFPPGGSASSISGSSQQAVSPRESAYRKRAKNATTTNPNGIVSPRSYSTRSNGSEDALSSSTQIHAATPSQGEAEDAVSSGFAASMTSIDGSLEFGRQPSILSNSAVSEVSTVVPEDETPRENPPASPLFSPKPPKPGEDPLAFLDALPPASPDRK